MTTPERTVTLHGSMMSLLLFCSMVILSCADELLPPDQPPVANRTETILYTWMHPDGTERIMSLAPGTQTPQEIARGILASPPQSGRIAYYSAHESDGEGVYTMYLDGSDKGRMAFDAYKNIDPMTVTLAPNGSTVAFVSHDIYTSEQQLHIVASGVESIMPLSGITLHLPEGGEGLWFSPESDGIVFGGTASWFSGYSLFYVLIDSAVVYLVATFDLPVTGMAIPPIDLPPAFTVQGRGIFLGDTISPTVGEWLVRSNDTYTNPVWSPDASTIAATVTTAAGTDLYTVAVPGGSLRRITHSPSTPEMYASWMNDRMLLYTEVSNDFGTERRKGRMMTVDVVTGTTTVVAEDVYRAFAVRNLAP